MVKTAPTTKPPYGGFVVGAVQLICLCIEVMNTRCGSIPCFVLRYDYIVVRCILIKIFEVNGVVSDKR